MALVISGLGQSKYTDVEFEDKTPHDWENQAISEINRELPRAYFIPFSSAKQALQNDLWKSPFIQTLNGTWQFNLSHTSFRICPLAPGEKPVEKAKVSYQ